MIPPSGEIIIECPKEFQTEKYEKRSDCPGRKEVNIKTLFYADGEVGETIQLNLQQIIKLDHLKIF